MSLINKMLKDLETRQGGGARAGRPLFQDLHSARGSRQSNYRIPIVALVLLLVGVAGIYSWNRWRNNTVTVVSAPTITVAQAPVAAEPVLLAPAVAEPPPVAAPVITSAAKAPAPVAKPKPAKKQEAPVISAKPVVSAAVESGTGTGPASIEKTAVPYSAEEMAEHSFQEASRLRKQGDGVGAERQLNSLLATQPKHVKARELLSGLQLDSGRWLEAQATLEQGVAQLPTHLGFRYLLARLYLEHGKLDEAVNLLEAARKPGVNDPELSAFLAALYQRANRHADAVKSYQEALTSRPLEGRWWVGLGISLETQKDTDAARSAYRNALDTGRLTSSLTRYAEDRQKALTAR